MIKSGELEGREKYGDGKYGDSISIWDGKYGDKYGDSISIWWEIGGRWEIGGQHPHFPCEEIGGQHPHFPCAVIIQIYDAC